MSYYFLGGGNPEKKSLRLIHTFSLPSPLESEGKIGQHVPL